LCEDVPNGNSVEGYGSAAEGVAVGTRPTILALAVIAAVGGCDPDGGAAANREADWPAPLRHVNSRPEDIAVLSGTTFDWGGVHCQLLGVKESDDPQVRKRADEFTRTWFKSIGNLMAVYNHTNPLTAADGTAVVWIRGYDGSLSCLSEELVRAGLVEIDDAQWADYTFTVPTKTSEKVEDWRAILRGAREGYAQGEKPRVLFEWPPK
jgi:hypothetical protein